MDENVMLFAGTAILFLMAFALLLFSILYQLRIRNKERENQLLKNLLQTSELEYLSKHQELLETERQKISEDIHHHLGGLLATLQQTWLIKSKSDWSTEDIEFTTRLIKNIIGETKKISNAVYMLSQIGDLEDMLQDLVANVTRAIPISFTTQTESISGLNNQMKRDLFRMIQEMVSNTLKYAHATHIHLDISQPDPTQLSVLYEDNGKGFQLEQTVKGMGLKSLEQTAQKYQGTFDIESGTKGTTIALLLYL